MTGKLLELGYCGFAVSSLPDWERFAIDVLGIEVRPGAAPGTRLMRFDEYSQRIILVEGPTDDIAFAGWKTTDAAALDAFARHLTASGIAFDWGADDELALRHIERMLHFTDPLGVRHEAYYGLAIAPEPFVSPKLRSHYITGYGGLGHLVFGSSDYAGSNKFATEILGMALSDVIHETFAPGVAIDVHFYHLNERHHSVAYADKFHPVKKLHHFMLEVGQVEDVGYARDRHLAAGFGIAQDIGQHPNDRMISYYGVTPSGFLIEFGWGGIKIDDAVWQTTTYQKLSEWGHRPPG